MSRPRPEDHQLLVVDDEPLHAEATADALRVEGFPVVEAVSGKQALEQLRQHPFDLVITDLLLGDMDGLELLREARAINPFCEVIVTTGHGTVESAVEAMRRGAADYLEKPVDIQTLRIRVRKALEGQALKRRADELERTIDRRYGFQGIIGSSPQMDAIVQQLSQIAPADVSVLILGETGTGKELFAKALHTNSRRREKPFVPLNCAALSEGILESELFGHVKGAFTGATYTRKGRFEHASGGTLFLDEVGDIPMSTQVKLLRVLEDRQVYRIGDNEPISVDVRLISATHKDLQRGIAEGTFREDLFFRLNVVSVEVPPLRQRTIDIPLLCEHFMHEYSRIHGKPIEGIAREALRILTRYRWPGNVRELKNVLENMVVTSTSPILGVADIPARIRPPDESPTPASGVPPVGTTLEELELALIRSTLEAVQGNRKEAARLLGIGERTLYRKIAEHDIR